jgi:chromatin remodeling complex protein RSC6
MPDIPTFPVFPDPYPVTYDDTTDMVSMPLWYWQKIAEYKIDIDAIESYINQIQDIKKDD